MTLRLPAGQGAELDIDTGSGGDRERFRGPDQPSVERTTFVAASATAADASTSRAVRDTSV